MPDNNTTVNQENTTEEIPFVCPVCKSNIPFESLKGFVCPFCGAQKI